MHHALIWLLVVEAMGLIAVPICFSLFRRLPDRGLILSKVLALLLVSYLLWILGTAHVLPNSIYSIIGILAVLALGSGFLLRRNLPDILAFVRRQWLPLLTAEIVFLGLFALWLSIVSSAPAINHTEKPMDFAFLNSILRSNYFPPQDPWLAGHSISYYYFGHLIMATLTKLTAIPSNISYNLSIALIPALVGAGAFGLVYNLIRLSGAQLRTAVLFALAAPALLVLIGNLEGVLELVRAGGLGSDGFWQWLSIKGIESAPSGNTGAFPQDHLWWWRATRVIDTVVDGRSLDYTITEFPFFSFLLGDLHAHVSALPFIILNLAMGLNLFISEDRLGLSWLRCHPGEALAMALALGSLAFINIWDFPVFAILFGALLLGKGYADWGVRARYSVLVPIALLATVVAGAVLLYLPFFLSLDSQASGIWPAREVMSTRPVYFFLIWGLFLVLGSSFLLRRIAGLPRRPIVHPWALAVVLVLTLLPFLMWAGFALIGSPFDDGLTAGARDVGGRLGRLLPGLVVVGVALYSALVILGQTGQRASAFVVLSLALAFYVILGAELFYVVDLFGNRMNTVFKLYFQAWLLLSIVSAYALYYCTRPLPSTGLGPSLIENVKGRVRLPWRPLGKAVGYGWVGAVVILLLASLYYPVAAARDRTREVGNTSLDGLAFLQDDEYTAIEWLRDEAQYGRIVEAVGDDYTEYGRISASTGLPTVLGWRGHEHQWRGSTRLFDDRQEEVRLIYRTPDVEELRDLLDAYDVRYVYVGPRERVKYGQSRFDAFSSLLQPVFTSRNVVIYERLSSASPTLAESNDGNTG